MKISEDHICQQLSRKRARHEAGCTKAADRIEPRRQRRARDDTATVTSASVARSVVACQPHSANQRSAIRAKRHETAPHAFTLACRQPWQQTTSMLPITRRSLAITVDESWQSVQATSKADGRVCAAITAQDDTAIANRLLGVQMAR